MAYPRIIHPCLAILFLVFLFPRIEAHDERFTVKLFRENYQSDYLMELSIGTPPRKTYAIADTGSDLIWFQCIPCPNCYKQLNPMFDPQTSSTYTNIACGSESCPKAYSNVCSPDHMTCNYTCSYKDHSMTQGVLAQETLTLTSSITREPVPLEGIIFGCGHNNNGLFDDHEMGLIGLGRGPLSLVSQIGSSLGGSMFSQCLVPFHTNPSITSQISFGKGSQVLGNGVVSTPLVSKGTLNTEYYVTLLGISVEDTNLPFNGDSNIEPIAKGNMFIDLGTSPTTLPEQFYNRLLEQVRNKVALEPIPDPSSVYELCYRTQTNLKRPTLTVHFEGADVVLTPTQIFIPVQDGIFCFSFISSNTNEYGIYGNYAQSNYLIGYDMERQVISFKATDCTNIQDAPSTNGVLPNFVSAPTYLLLLPFLLIILQN